MYRHLEINTIFKRKSLRVNTTIFEIRWMGVFIKVKWTKIILELKTQSFKITIRFENNPKKKWIGKTSFKRKNKVRKRKLWNLYVKFEKLLINGGNWIKKKLYKYLK